MNGPRVLLRPSKVSAADVEPNRRLGGAVRVLLSPRSAMATAGFMAVLDLEPGEHVTEHYHPYSDEHVCVTAGRIVMLVDGAELVLDARESVLVRRGARHRYENRGEHPATAVLFLGPLAPRPELGHVETEGPAAPEAPAPGVGEPV